MVKRKNLTAETEGRIREVLAKHEEGSVNRFLFWLDQDLGMFTGFATPVDLSEHRRRLGQVRQRILKLQSDLKYLADNKIVPQAAFDDTSGEAFAGLVQQMQKGDQAVKVCFGSLSILDSRIADGLGYLKKQAPAKGRPSADRAGLVKSIAENFREEIGTPTGYPKGDFRKIVEIIFEHLELPSADPARAVQKALK